MTGAQPRIHPNIRQSTDADLASLMAWLKQQAHDGVDDTFWCNRRLTVKAHNEGGLLVYIDPELRQPVAYQWGGFISPGILEVRNDMRGRGIGKALVEHSLALAAQAGDDLLWIQCKPSSSIEFWQRMGFTLLDDKDDDEQENYAYRVMPRKRDLLEGATKARVTLEWFPEDRKWNTSVAPVVVQTIEGGWRGHHLELSERASFFSDLVERDVVVRIAVDEKEWYCDKAKYDDADSMGVKRCSNGYRIDTLNRPREAE